MVEIDEQLSLICQFHISSKPSSSEEGKSEEEKFEETIADL
jgi:hypothetical protein